jgi:hypothetical protein
VKLILALITFAHDYELEKQSDTGYSPSIDSPNAHLRLILRILFFISDQQNQALYFFDNFLYKSDHG